ncbi:MAG: dTDP-4-dehydrorhamnose reductase [Vicinamibacterales bacterium]
MRIAVTGREGQVVRSLVDRSHGRPGFDVVAIGRPQLDLQQPETVLPALSSVRPDLIVSAAAYTAVDRAEDEPEVAAAVNAAGAGKVAETAAALSVPVIHLSTDYVFAGDGGRPYDEQDRPEPQSVYGRTKLAGEVAVASENPRHVILRTAWVYSPFGKNFVKTMLFLAADRGVVRVVADQFGNPTSALDIADAILAIAPKLVGEAPASRFGVFHLAGTGSTHWAGLAARVFDTSRALGGPWARVEAITTVDYPTRARRPANSRLSTDHLRDVFGWQAPDWRVSCDAVVRRLVGAAE